MPWNNTTSCWTGLYRDESASGDWKDHWYSKPGTSFPGDSPLWRTGKPDNDSGEWGGPEDVGALDVYKLAYNDAPKNLLQTCYVCGRTK